MSRLIDADKLSADMYHEAFEKDSDMQKWDSGCWIRYKMFENVLEAQPTVEAPDINVGSMDTTTHDSIPAETGKNDGDRTSGDCISRTQAIDDLCAVCGKACDKSKFVYDAPQDEQVIICPEHYCLCTLPSVQPERPKGKWIHQAKFGRIECDQCGKVFRNSFAPKNFCPNCGADMRGETE